MQNECTMDKECTFAMTIRLKALFLELLEGSGRSTIKHLASGTTVKL